MNFKQIFAICTAALSVTSATPGLYAGSSRVPNIVFILADDK